MNKVCMQGFGSKSFRCKPYSAFFKAGWLGAAVALILACTPQLDWRLHRDTTQTQAYSVEFPGKPDTAQRLVTLANQQVQLTLQGVHVEGMQFVVGYVPAQSGAQAQQFAQALADTFVTNYRATRSPRPLAGIKRSVGTQQYEIVEGPMRGGAWFVWNDHVAFELIAVGPAKTMSVEAVDQFFRSFQIE